MKLRLNLGTRITLVLVVLLAVVLGLTQNQVERQNIAGATENITADLEVAREVFNELLDSRSASLLDIVRPATRDHAFRMAYGSDHVPTLESAMRNLMGRITQIPTDMMLITDLDGEMLAYQSATSELPGQEEIDWLIERALESPILEATGVSMVGDQPHQIVITPMLIPAPDAWILLGFPIDENFLATTSAITRKGVSVLVSDESGARFVRSDLPDLEQQELLDTYQSGDFDMANVQQVTDSGDQLLALLVPLVSSPQQQILVALHDSLTLALQPWRRLNQTLAWIFAGALAASFIAAIFLGQNLSAPLRRLTQSVKAIAAGEYKSRVAVKSSDEVGQLASAVNEMAHGLEEREKVRSLLGKVVSEEIAQELLHSDLKLGGEERELTVLFCDVLDFTTLCEGAQPEQILAQLNEYFSGASEIIERNGGVVDKYMGDAVMALFGAPVANDTHAASAVKALLELRQYAIERKITAAGKPFAVGLGVATGLGVVGNMGSENRLNYTVIGDSVNLAARLESLTRLYGIAALVSEATARDNAVARFRLIDKVQVKGKTQPELIYEPLTLDYDAQRLEKHHQALNLYFDRQWQAARDIFAELQQEPQEAKLYGVYIQRCEQLIAEAPDNWDGIQRFRQK